MSERLKGKRCLVTAAAQGIGRATALAFAREGAEVVATDVNGGLLDQLHHGTAGVSVSLLDVTDASAVAMLSARVGPIDVLFNCAGYVHQGSILQCQPSDSERSFRINVDSVYGLCRNLLPGMLQRGHGSVINVSSGSALLSWGLAQPQLQTRPAQLGVSRSVSLPTATAFTPSI